MSRNKTHSPISLFSFQDIIMSVVGIMILITLVLLLHLVSQMFAAPPEPTITEEELRQRIASLKPIQAELRDSIAQMHRFREESEVFTPSQEEVDALQSAVTQLETDIALTEKAIEEIKKRIDELRNDPARRQLSEIQKEVKTLTDKIAGLRPHAGQAGVQMRVVAPKKTDKKAFIVDYGKGIITVIPADGSPKLTFPSADRFDAWVAERDPKKEHYVVYVRPSRFEEHNASGKHNRIVTNLRERGFDVGLQVIGEKAYLTLND
jgi:uncharacterized coiled-coil protein SlyX